LTIVVVLLIIKKFYFSVDVTVNAIKDEEYHELKMGLHYKKKKNILINNKTVNDFEDQ
jgi:hypothetical protein